MAEYGVANPANLSALDTSLSVPAGGTWTSGNGVDLLDATANLLGELEVQISVTGGATDGYDIEVIAQYSEDNTNWPDDGDPDAIVYSKADSAGGASITRSPTVPIGTPTARYARLQYKNNNATDAVTVTSKYTIRKGKDST